MKPPTEWTENDILDLNAVEQDWIEFKGSQSLDLTLPGVDENRVRSELSKQLSAFSNSGGGTLIYGVTDPVVGHNLKIDNGGVSLKCKGKSTKEWLEDIIPVLVDFPLKDFNVFTIGSSLPGSQIANGKGLVIISIPDSGQAPHQANDKRYYARVGGKSLPIGHRLVMDIYGRAQYPKMEIALGFEKNEETKLLELKVLCGNVGRIYANYVNGAVYIPMVCFTEDKLKSLDIVSRDGWRCVRFPFENIHQDVVGIHSNPFVGKAFTVTRFNPVLPQQHFSIPIELTISIQEKHDLATKEIVWEIFADNAPMQTAKIRIGNIINI